jgi:hypothetical protein
MPPKILTAEELNKIAQGSGYTGGTFSSVGLPAPKPVSVLSSTSGQNIVNQNTSNLQKIETGYMGPSVVDYLNSTGQASDINSRAKLASQYGINYDTKATGDKSAQQNTQLLQALRNVSSSPASSAMVNGINGAMSGGIGMTEAEKAGLAGVTSAEDAITEAAAKARAALEAKDYKSMDYWTAKANENRKIYEDQLSEYYKSTKDLRSALATSMVPGAREQELSKKLIDIRGQAERFKLQTQKDKFSEFEGQSLGFAGGRASEIDRLASFKNQEFALDEKNLLLSLGLEQDAREMEGKSIEQQLTHLSEDFDLQQKVQAKLDAQEEALFNKADKLQDDAKANLISIVNELQGVDPSKMDPTSLKQLEDLSARSGIPFNLVTEALATQYAKQTFDNALKNKQEARLSSKGSGGGESTKPLSILDVNRYNELYPDAGVTAGDSEAIANAKVAQSQSPEAQLRNLIVSAQEAGNDYKTVLKEIDNDASIKDKDVAKAIAAEVYGVSTTQATPSKIEQEIASMPKAFDASMKRDLLRRRGFSQSEIANSSVGNPMEKAISIVDSISKALFK